MIFQINSEGINTLAAYKSIFSAACTYDSDGRNRFRPNIQNRRIILQIQPYIWVYYDRFIMIAICAGFYKAFLYHCFFILLFNCSISFTSNLKG